MKIIFICTGNTCRSPMAEGYLKSLNFKGVEVTSRGLYPGGDAVSNQSVTAMEKIGVDIKGHVSKELTHADLDADMFFCMTDSHARALLSAGIEKSKIYVPRLQISDPFMKGQDVYDLCRDEIINAVNDALFSGLIVPFRVDTATYSDVKDIALLEKECFSDPWSENAINESMSASTLFFTAKTINKTVGYIGLSVVADEAYITNIAVLKDYRNLGIGTLLLLKAIDETKQKCKFISLEVRVSNQKAINLYTKMRFLKEGLRKGFYNNPKEDAIIMTRRF